MKKYTFNPNLLWWALYDWGNSAFAAIIQTFVFAAYFTQQVAVNETIGSAQWGFVNGAAAFFIAVSAPVFGAIADHGKKRKKWIIFFTALCILSTMLLWFVRPDAAYSQLALWVVGAGTIGSELAFVFYNAMLPSLAPKGSIGKWSGWGWGLGYAGGVASLLLALFLVVDNPALLSSKADSQIHLRATFPLVGVWYLVFSLPLLLLVPDTSGKGKTPLRAVRDGLLELAETFRQVRKFRSIVKFLIARMLFIDGLTTLFIFGGVYAASAFDMDSREILFFGVALNLSAGIGAAAFAWIDDLIGGKKLILISLTGLIVPTALILFAVSKLSFWILGIVLGVFVGPVQSASRSHMARIAPEHLRNEMFGFFALSGKATAFLGPMLVGWVTFLSGSQRIGMSVILVFLLLGFLVMLTVPSAEDA